MTLKELLNTVELDDFDFIWEDEFTPYYALEFASSEIYNIIMQNPDLDYDELFDTIIGFVPDRDSNFEHLRDTYDINDDKLYSSLVVKGIYSDELHGGLLIRVSFYTKML